jgi:AbrB family looped-hinge helix DNA binding protein
MAKRLINATSSLYGHREKLLTYLYKVRVGKQGRIVLPKELREACGISVGDEAVIMVEGERLTLHIHKVSDDPIQDLRELSETISLGLSAEELKKRGDEERLKHLLNRGNS